MLAKWRRKSGGWIARLMAAFSSSLAAARRSAGAITPDRSGCSPLSPRGRRVAHCFRRGRAVETMSFPDPTPGPDDVVLEMKASGMCGSDLHQYRRPKGQPRVGSGLAASVDPTIAGHEPCGV